MKFGSVTMEGSTDFKEVISRVVRSIASFERITEV